MKKIILSATILFAALTGFCQSDVVITASTDQLTKLTHNVGIKSLAVSGGSGRYNYVISAEDAAINNTSYVLDKKTFTVTETATTITLMYQGDKVAYSKSDKGVVVTGVLGTSFTLVDIKSNSFKQSEMYNITYALVLLSEVTDKVQVRTSPNPTMAGRKTGSYVTYNGGFGQSTSILNTQAEVNQFLHDNPNCSLYGTMDTSCLFDQHVCVSSQHYNCV